MEKRNYEAPEMEVVFFDIYDVIATSCTPNGCGLCDDPDCTVADEAN